MFCPGQGYRPNEVLPPGESKWEAITDSRMGGGYLKSGSRSHGQQKSQSGEAGVSWWRQQILEAKQRGQVPVKPEPWSEEQPTPDETPPEPGHWSRAVSWEIFPFSRRFIAFQCVLTMNP